MKLLTKARETSIQQQILSQADTIRYLKEQITKLETENRMQAERIAGLEAVLYAAGVLDKDAVLASDGDKAWYADQVLERYEGNNTSSAAEAAPSPQGEGMGGEGSSWCDMSVEPYMPYVSTSNGGAV